MDEPAITPPANDDDAPPLPLPQRRYGSAALLVALLLATVAFCITMAPVASPVLLGALLAGVTAPLVQRLSQRYPHRSLFAALVTLVTILVVVVPLGLLALALVDRFNAVLASGAPARWLSPQGPWREVMQRYPAIEKLLPKDLGDQLASSLEWVANALPALLTGIANSFIGVFLCALTLFYLLKDGPALVQRLEKALPLEPRHTRAIILEFRTVGRAFIIGTLGTAGLQAALAGLGYYFLHLPEPLLLGALTFVMAIVPAVGSGLVWAPIVVYLFATGDTSKALILLLYGGLVVSTADNLARPLLQRGGLHVHPLLMFLGIFGGLAVFGAGGVYLGPLVVALFMAVAHIYEQELAPAATTAPPLTTAEFPVLWRAARSIGRSLVRRR